MIEATAKVLRETGFRVSASEARATAEKLTVQQHREVNQPGTTKEDFEDHAGDDDYDYETDDGDTDNPFWYHES